MKLVDKPVPSSLQSLIGWLFYQEKQLHIYAWNELSINDDVMTLEQPLDLQTPRALKHGQADNFCECKFTEDFNIDVIKQIFDRGHLVPMYGCS